MGIFTLKVDTCIVACMYSLAAKLWNVLRVR